MPKVSVITVTYNCQSVIEETILSIINQSFKDFEFIVIDGSSKDRTLQIINKYSPLISILISEPDKGIYDAMNKGLATASGEWIIFMNAGDKFSDNDVLQKVFSSKKSISEDVIFGKCNLKYGTRIVQGKRPIPFYEQKRICPSMGYSHQSVFVKKEALGGICFDTNYKIAADYNMFKQLYNRGVVFKYIDIPISDMDMADGLSANNRKLQRLEMAKINGVENDILFKMWLCYRSVIEIIKIYINRR